MERLNSILQKYTATTADATVKDKLIGASFIVTNKDETIYSGSSGRIGLDVGSPAWTTESFTCVASMTKLVTVVAVMQLVEQGLVKLEDDMRELIPQLREMKILRGFEGDAGMPILEENTKPMTLLNLLTHTAGLGYDVMDPNLMRWHKAVGREITSMAWTLDGIVTPLIYPPGEGWSYGSANDWAGQVLEKITGKDLSSYVQSNIFDPLGIMDSSFWPQSIPHVAARTAEYTQRQEDGTLIPASPLFPKDQDHTFVAGGAGLYSTGADYATLLKGLLSVKLLKKKTTDKMFTPQLDERQNSMLSLVCKMMPNSTAPEFPPDLKINHGIGGLMNVEDSPGKRRKGSISWSGLFNSRWWLDPTTGIAAVLFTNIQPMGDVVVRDLYRELEAAVYEELLA